MIRKANGKTKPHGSANGGAAVLDQGAQDERRSADGAAQKGDRQTELVFQEIGRLVEASRQGSLDERGRLEQFDGVHREMLRGVNEMLDAILLPIGEGNRILAQISAGKIDELIAQTYKGDHEKMKQAVNNVAVVLQTLAEGTGAADRGLQRRATLRARQAGEVSRARTPRSCAASTPCWMRFCCRSGKATAFSRRFPPARSTS